MKLLRTKSSPGDLFYIPAINGEGAYGFVLGRYIGLVGTNAGYLIEVFARFYTNLPLFKEDVDVSERLFRPIMCSLRFAEIPRWKILFSDPNYKPSKSDYENISLAFYREIWIGGRSKPAKREEMVGLEDSTSWRMHHIIFRVNAHLAGYFGPEDCYDYHRLPAEERVDNPVAQKRVIDLAVEMDIRSKDWFKSGKRKPR